MKEQQRAMLLDLISEWTGIINKAYGTVRMAEIKAGLDDTYVAWSGPITHEQGKTVPLIIAFRGQSCSSSSRHKAWAAIQRCTSTRYTAIPLTTMDVRLQSNENKSAIFAGCVSLVGDSRLRP